MTDVADPIGQLFDDETDATLDRLVPLIRKELESLGELLPDALNRQWTHAPIPRPREDTSERSKGGPPADPTSETAVDVRRLALRAQVIACERVMRDSLLRLRVVRLALGRSVARWDGEGSSS